VFVLPVVTVAGWILTWWGSRRTQWVLLSAAAVVSVLCVIAGAISKGPPATPQSVSCSPAFACMDPHPIYWIATGLIGVVCCVALMILTVLVEVVFTVGRRTSTRSL
jgi:hypothetical protein